MKQVTISYQEKIWYCEEAYDDVCKAISNGWPLTVYQWERGFTRGKDTKITFFGDVDWVAMEL